MYLSSALGALGLLAATTTAAPSSPPLLNSRQDCEFNSVDSPECWKKGFSLTSNYYDEVPPVDVGREPVVYNFELTNITISPDGIERTVLAINGKFPGPTIEAEWGDTVGKLQTHHPFSPSPLPLMTPS
jgi:hypothetical protein